MDPAYWRAYRARNRVRLSRQQSERRSTPAGRAKRAEYRSRPEVRARENAARRGGLDDSPMPAAFTGHPILELARSLAGSWYGTTLYDADREDAASEAVLAILESRDPREAIRAYRADVRARAALLVPLESLPI